jgi:hypothetical protein
MAAYLLGNFKVTNVEEIEISRHAGATRLV